MSMFESSRYRWRETCFVLFKLQHRPTLKKVEQALAALDETYQLVNASADDKKRIESLTVISPDDFAALDICFTSGEDVLEERESMIEELRPAAEEMGKINFLEKLRQCDARFDVLHFEEIPETPEDDEEPDEFLNPSALLLVLAELAKLTHGVAVDPQSATILSE